MPGDPEAYAEHQRQALELGTRLGYPEVWWPVGYPRPAIWIASGKVNWERDTRWLRAQDLGDLRHCVEPALIQQTRLL